MLRFVSALIFIHHLNVISYKYIGRHIHRLFDVYLSVSDAGRLDLMESVIIAKGLPNKIKPILLVLIRFM